MVGSPVSLLTAWIVPRSKEWWWQKGNTFIASLNRTNSSPRHHYAFRRPAWSVEPTMLRSLLVSLTHGSPRSEQALSTPRLPSRLPNSPSCDRSTCPSRRKGTARRRQNSTTRGVRSRVNRKSRCLKASLSSWVRFVVISSLSFSLFHELIDWNRVQRSTQTNPRGGGNVCTFCRSVITNWATIPKRNASTVRPLPSFDRLVVSDESKHSTGLLLEKEPNNFQSQSLNALIEKAVAKGLPPLVSSTCLSLQRRRYH